MTNNSCPAVTASSAIAALDDLTVVGVVDGLMGDVNLLRTEVGHLREALRTRAPIDQAKGILMLRFSIDADAAFQILVRLSSTTNVKVNVLAPLLVALVNGDPVGPDADIDTVRMLNETLRGNPNVTR